MSAWAHLVKMEGHAWTRFVALHVSVQWDSPGKPANKVRYQNHGFFMPSGSLKLSFLISIFPSHHQIICIVLFVIFITIIIIIFISINDHFLYRINARHCYHSLEHHRLHYSLFTYLTEKLVKAHMSFLTSTTMWSECFSLLQNLQFIDDSLYIFLAFIVEEWVYLSPICSTRIFAFNLSLWFGSG